MLFEGFNVCAAQIPHKSRDLLLGYVSFYKGEYSFQLTEKTTHLTCLSASGEIYREAQEKEIAVVYPTYFQHCIQLNRKLPVGPYLFPSPKVLDWDPTDLNSVRTELGPTAPSASDPSFLTSHSIILSKQLKITNQQKMSLTRSLKEFGAHVVSDFSDGVTLVVASYRSDPLFKSSSESNITIGTFKWIVDCIKHKTILDVNSNILYQITPPPLPLSNYVISVTNYHGKSREMIREMIVNLGATFTPQLTKKNTHLICALPTGEKYLKAKEWGVKVVNHTWIEEMYAKWSDQPIDGKHFMVPFMHEIVGLFSIDIQAHEKAAAHIEEEEEKQPNTRKSEPKRLREIKAQENTPQPAQPKRSDSVVFSRKRKTSPPSADIPSSNTCSPSIRSKRLKSTPKNSYSKIIFTSYKPTSRETNALKEAGYQIVQDINDADILIAAKIVRTEKTLIAINLGLPIVGKEWLSAIQNNHQADPVAYVLQDKEAEDKCGFELRKSLNRGSNFMQGYEFFVSSGVTPDYTTLKRVVESAGGIIRPLSEWTGNGFVVSSEEELGTGEVQSLYKRDITIYDVEIILTGVLRQKIEPEFYKIA